MPLSKHHRSGIRAEKFPLIFNSDASTIVLLRFCYQSINALATFAFKGVFIVPLTFIVISRSIGEAWITSKCIMHDILKLEKSLLLMHFMPKRSSNHREQSNLQSGGGEGIERIMAGACVPWILDSIIKFYRKLFPSTSFWICLKANKSNIGRVVRILTLD